MPVPDVVASVRSWTDAGVTVVLATNQEHRRVEYLRERLRAVLPVTDILYSADIGVEKHDERFFALASARLGLVEGAPAPVLLDDDLRNVETARRCGWSAVHFTGEAGWQVDVVRALRVAGQTAGPLPRG